MATKIVTKNSSTASAVPTASDLVQGELAVNVADKRLFTEDNGGAIVEVGTNPSTLTVTGEITANGGIALGDSDKATFGAGDDLQIYHDGSNSIIKDGGTGNLNILAGQLRIKNPTDAESLIEADVNGAVRLYHDNAAKLATTSTGIDVTGNMIADGVGIGTTPDAATVLHVQATEPQVLISDASSPLQRFMAFDVGLAADEDTHFITVDQADGLAFGEKLNGNDRVIENEWMRITNAGNVGIGESSPEFPLDIQADSAANAIQIIGRSSDNIGQITFTSNDKTTDYLDLQVGSSELRFQGRGSIPMTFRTDETERMRIDSSGRVGIGTSSPTRELEVTGSGNVYIKATAVGATDSAGLELDNAGVVWLIQNDDTSSDALTFDRAGVEAMRIDSSGRVGIGTSSPSAPLNVVAASGAIPVLGAASSHAAIGSSGFGTMIGTKSTGVGYIQQQRFDGTATSYSLLLQPNGGNVGIGRTPTSHILETAGEIKLTSLAANQGIDGYNTGSHQWGIKSTSATAAGVSFEVANTERMRIDASGNLLVGTTNASPVGNNVAGGIALLANGSGQFSRDGGTALLLNRKTNDGELLRFNKDSTAVGSIGTGGGDLIVGNGNVGIRFNDAISALVPRTTGDVGSDGALDLGASSARFDDIYATNGTIQTSDRNEKQDIAELSGAEQRVAVACKGLLRKFRWKDSVAEKGDDARIHFGIIAQDLQAAFEAEGLDAGDYGMFTSTTWTDEETNEEKTRMGVRYSELLAFIIAAL